MDNASYHKSASALAALSLFEHRVMLVWLPPYCSDLNPIEAVVTSAENILNAQNLDNSNLRFLLSKNL
jgi:transposase